MLRWRARLPVATLTHLPGGVFQHFISHVCPSACSAWQTQTARGQLWEGGVGGIKAPQQLQTLHGSASVRGSRLKLVTLHVMVASCESMKLKWRCVHVAASGFKNEITEIPLKSSLNPALHGTFR